MLVTDRIATFDDLEIAHAVGGQIVVDTTNALDGPGRSSCSPEDEARREIRVLAPKKYQGN